MRCAGDRRPREARPLPGRHAGRPDGRRRTPSVALDLLGRCSRKGRATPRPRRPLLTVELHAINGPWLNGKIADPKGRLQRLLEAKQSMRRSSAEFYQVALGRSPGEKEAAFWRKKFAGLEGEQRADALEDFLWALFELGGVHDESLA